VAITPAAEYHHTDAEAVHSPMMMGAVSVFMDIANNGNGED
jgi:hypothetical protein